MTEFIAALQTFAKVYNHRQGSEERTCFSDAALKEFQRIIRISELSFLTPSNQPAFFTLHPKAAEELASLSTRPSSCGFKLSVFSFQFFDTHGSHTSEGGTLLGPK